MMNHDFALDLMFRVSMLLEMTKKSWEDLVPKTELSYIIGNPPFIGERYQSKEQRAVLHTSRQAFS